MPSVGENVYVVDAVRTAIGRGHPQKGMHRNRHANELLGACFRALLDRTSLPANEVDDVLAGCVEQMGEQSRNIARNAWLQAGLPIEVPASTIDRQCGSGQQAVNFGLAMISSGIAEVVIAGGVEHLGHVPMSLEGAVEEQAGTPWPEELLALHDLVPQGIAAELLAERSDVSRGELDELSLLSHQRAHRAQAGGAFDAELICFEGPERDEGVRPDTSIEVLSELPPAFESEGRITAGNSSQISDGASAVLLASSAACARFGLQAKARIVDAVTVGSDPYLMLEGPIGATARLLQRNSLSLDDIGIFEINEAFAVVLAIWLREFDVDLEKLNPNGGAIALGHPLGSSGARLITTMVHELEAQDVERGLVAMCCRGGLGTGTLLERLS